MYLSYGTVALLFLCVLIVWFWQDSLRVRDIANGAAIEACARLGLQFLDGTVAFSKLSFVRDAGRLRLRRTYVFDYTAHSIGRLQGFVMLVGDAVESVGFARDEARQARAAGHDTAHFQPSQDVIPSQTIKPSNVAARPDATGKVTILDDWRHTHETRH